MLWKAEPSGSGYDVCKRETRLVIVDDDRGLRCDDKSRGEIAIICEDILSLKQKVDNPIPLGKSLPSSSWSFGRSSVNSSAYRSPSSTSSTNINKEVPEKNEQPENTSNGENLLAKLAKTSLDDWVELF
ncbi:hypothetical protein AXF42_Ash016857 [Apostasia shenzhenica]|uniref:Uncharacterized protein n=1 Tax=Apostasia shenzhenica TaxID=1088818 RepID=A0A2I0BAL3_9ASPA|nr:hypothetical protein AXF42_Ash016857 [Apostasia shenzhenica]